MLSKIQTIHTSGVSLSNTLSDEDYTDLNRICRWLENYIPESKPGEKIAYHEVTYGWILGELVERITKKSFQESFIELVKNPLNLSSMKFMTVNNERLPLEIYKHESSNLNTIPTIFKLFALNAAYIPTDNLPISFPCPHPVNVTLVSL